MAKRGRPPMAKAERRRNIVSVRLRDDTLKELTKAAQKSGRSISQEAEFLIERAFFEDVLGATNVNLFRLYQLETFRALRTVLTKDGVRDRQRAIEDLIANMETDFKESRLQSLDELEDGKGKSLNQMDEEMP